MTGPPPQHYPNQLLPPDRSRLLLLLACLPPAVVAVAAWLVVPGYAALFNSFGPLPLETTVLLATYRWWGVIALCVLAIWAFWPKQLQGQIIALAFGVLSACFMLLFGFFALYAPFIKMGMEAGT